MTERDERIVILKCELSKKGAVESRVGTLASTCELTGEEYVFGVVVLLGNALSHPQNDGSHHVIFSSLDIYTR